MTTSYSTPVLADGFASSRSGDTLAERHYQDRRSQLGIDSLSSSSSASGYVQPHPHWDKITHALANMYPLAEDVADCPDPQEPTRQAIEMALWIAQKWRAQSPAQPPTSFQPDGCGGIVMERYDAGLLRSFTIYAEGDAAEDITLRGHRLSTRTLPAQG